MQARLAELRNMAIEFTKIEDYAERQLKGMWLNERLIDLDEEGIPDSEMPYFRGIVKILVDEIMVPPSTDLDAMRKDAQTNSGLYLP